jgi:hypothetical protein
MSRNAGRRFAKRIALRTLALALLISGAAPHLAVGQSARAIQVGGAASNRYALLVGISDYPGEDQDLGGGPLNDVALMTDLLVNRLGFPRSNILILTDEQATWLNIVTGFSAHLSRADRDGVALFYYSGHGAQLPNVGADREGDDMDEVIVTYGSAPGRITPFRDDELGLLTGFLRTDRVLVVLDNCYSGTGTRGGRSSVRWRDIAREVSLPSTLRQLDNKAPRAIGKRLTNDAVARMGIEPASGLEPRVLDEPRTHVLLAASAENEVSLNVPFTMDDGSRAAVGLFTAALYTELAEADLATTSFSDLATALRTTSRRVTARLGEAPQTPRAEGARRDAFVGPFLGVQ